MAAEKALHQLFSTSILRCRYAAGKTTVNKYYKGDCEFLSCCNLSKLYTFVWRQTLIPKQACGLHVAYKHTEDSKCGEP